MRMRVSRSRPCNLGASSLGSLTRVCNAIRSALFGKQDFALRNPIIPELCRCYAKLTKLSQRIKLFHDIVKLLFALAYNTRGSFLERLFGWNAIEPALLGELLVARKIEPDQQIHFAIRGWASSEASVCLDLCFALDFTFGFSAFGASAGLWACSGAAFASSSARSSLYCSFLSRRKACFQPSSLCRASWAFSSSVPKSNRRYVWAIKLVCDAGAGKSRCEGHGRSHAIRGMRRSLLAMGSVRND